MHHIECIIGKKFGDKINPLLDSVRTGGGDSNPLKMDINLNPRLNNKIVAGLQSKTGKENIAYDSYRKFIKNFGIIVISFPKADFEKILQSAKTNVGDTDLKTEDIKNIITEYKLLIKEKKRT